MNGLLISQRINQRKTGHDVGSKNVFFTNIYGLNRSSQGINR